MADRTSSGFDDLKLVVFNAQLLDNDFERIEREFGIDLGRSALGSDDRDDDYYPQFDEDLRREAAEMAAHYEVFYCLEKSIRRLISQTLEVAVKATWWESGRIPAAVVTDVAKRMQREVDSAVTVRSSEPLDFTTFGELGEIIKSNWDLFGSIFDSQRAVEKVMASLNTLRGPIAHCSPLAADEVLRLQLAMRDWFRLMS